jgi:hypothetical protein
MTAVGRRLDARILGEVRRGPLASLEKSEDVDEPPPG